ncbi:unnamed protein product [Blepharisma stoltei]|uniref:EF-hand domain-containing protein n=1 Tax=Blepharisma stoltei TaxID=1481888 RepID=A0AAU9JHH1_9CILI|nr:unnamed protein product [Blepharisma stoltei]
MNTSKIRGPRTKRLVMITPSDSHFSKEEELFARQNFNYFDIEGTSEIDMEELPSLLRRMGLSMEKARLDKYYRMFFGPNLETLEQTISWDRFLILFSMIMRNQLPIFRLKLVNPNREVDYISYAQRALDDAISIFTELDINETGVLGYAELNDIFNCLGLNDPYKDNFKTFLDKQFEKSNKRLDEKVDFDEFVDFYNNLLDLIY